jgi:hypothetical protein
MKTDYRCQRIMHGGIWVTDVTPNQQASGSSPSVDTTVGDFPAVLSIPSIPGHVVVSSQMPRGWWYSGPMDPNFDSESRLNNRRRTTVTSLANPTAPM